MAKISTKKYKNDIKNAVDLFWDTRRNQSNSRKKSDQGNRSSVTGGKHLDGFVKLMVKVAIDIGIPKDCIYTKGNALPGYFRPTKTSSYWQQNERWLSPMAITELKKTSNSHN